MGALTVDVPAVIKLFNLDKGGGFRLFAGTAKTATNVAKYARIAGTGFPSADAFFGADPRVQKAIWDAFILGKDLGDVRTTFYTSFGVDPENICWGGMVSAGCKVYESLDTDKEWCEAIHGKRAAICAYR